MSTGRSLLPARRSSLCENIVFDQRGVAMLIHFGDAGHSFASVDPVTLELSTIFHLQAARLPPGLPLEALLGQWETLMHMLRAVRFLISFAPAVSGLGGRWIAPGGVGRRLCICPASASSMAIRIKYWRDTLICHCIAQIAGGAAAALRVQRHAIRSVAGLCCAHVVAVSARGLRQKPLDEINCFRMIFNAVNDTKIVGEFFKQLFLRIPQRRPRSNRPAKSRTRSRKAWKAADAAA